MTFRLLIFFLIFLPSMSFGQLNGTYCLKMGFDVECITFHKNDSFEYSYYSCGYIDSGTGKYFLKNNNLTFTFDDPNVDSSKFIVEQSKSDAENDSVKIEISVYDFETKEKLSAIVWIKNIKDELIRKEGLYSPIEPFTFKKNNEKVKVSVKEFGYEPTEFSVNLDSNNIINVFLRMDLTMHIPEGKSKCYNIRNIRKKSFQMKEFISEQKFNTYKKASE